MAGAAVSACSLTVALIALRSLRVTLCLLSGESHGRIYCVISGFRSGAIQILALLGRYAAACSGSY